MGVAINTVPTPPMSRFCLWLWSVLAKLMLRAWSGALMDQLFKVPLLSVACCLGTVLAGVDTVAFNRLWLRNQLDSRMGLARSLLLG